ncbi:MAG TPA: hypothetical protein VMU51_35240 [Mycobacteriales bacterium]|nr:hypothetical protein [Mycobacteriales bacterium]
MRGKISLFAVAGVSVGAATVSVIPAPAFAAPATPTGATQAHQPTARTAPAGRPATATSRKAPAAVAAALPCNGTRRLARGGGFIFVPTTNTGSTVCELGFGDAGAPVTKVQSALIDCYHKNLGPTGADGQWGARTQAAIQEVRASKGLGNPQDYTPALVQAGFLFPVDSGGCAAI